MSDAEKMVREAAGALAARDADDVIQPTDPVSTALAVAYAVVSRDPTMKGRPAAEQADAIARAAGTVLSLKPASPQSYY